MQTIPMQGKRFSANARSSHAVDHLPAILDLVPRNPFGAWLRQNASLVLAMQNEEFKACVALLEYANLGGEVKNEVSEDIAHALLIELEQRQVLAKKPEADTPF